ncbi:hypothetical protein IFM51744_10360 [Aspergillus udagawae]|nr:hypothetical protein IFM51744_10360 [Aspergillus udagawae]
MLGTHLVTDHSHSSLLDLLTPGMAWEELLGHDPPIFASQGCAWPVVLSPLLRRLRCPDSFQPLTRPPGGGVCRFWLAPLVGRGPPQHFRSVVMVSAQADCGIVLVVVVVLPDPLGTAAKWDVSVVLLGPHAPREREELQVMVAGHPRPVGFLEMSLRQAAGDRHLAHSADDGVVVAKVVVQR